MTSPSSPPSPPAAPQPRWWRSDLARWLMLYVVLVVVVGLLAGLFWVNVVDLPTYTMRADQTAYITERGMTQFFAIDAWFVVIGAILGIGLGIIAWRWFRPLGWPIAVIAAVGAEVSALACWGFATLIGPGPINQRIAGAGVGDQIPIEFTLHAYATLAVWPFFALLPILLASALMPDPEDLPDPAEPRRRWFRRSPGGDGADAVDGSALAPQPERAGAGEVDEVGRA